jgi:hypothetical protein
MNMTVFRDVGYTYETSITFYQTTRLNTPEDRHFHLENKYADN